MPTSRDPRLLHALFVQYWGARTSLHLHLPGMSIEMIDTMAETICCEVTEVKTPALKSPVKAKPALKSPPLSDTARERQLQGRQEVLEQKRPTLRQALLSVLGNATMNITTLMGGLEAKGWLPRSRKPREQVAASLSQMKKVGSTDLQFERVPTKGRGFYRVNRKASIQAAASDLN